LYAQLLCPISRLADIPLVNGGTNSRILLLLRSVTQRSPEASNAMPWGLSTLLVGLPEVVSGAQVAVERFGWPITSEADIPFVNGGTNSRILQLLWSTTHRSP
jgi:hypothetical protein